jgi:branched-chain amino acid aminotransferase
VAETNATNIFLVSAGSLGTPSAAACPEGITRQAVLDLAGEAGIDVIVGDFSLTQLYTADELFVTGTMGGLTSVLAVDGRAIGGGRPGPLTAKLAALFAQLTASSGTPIG